MTELRFIPVFEDEQFITAAAEYAKIWIDEKEKINKAFSSYTNLSLAEKRIAVIVYEGVSFSGRHSEDIMKLRASYPHEVKKGILIHELSHRLLFNLKQRPAGDDHSIIDLFLYDIWTELYGKKFAETMIENEKKLSPLYAKSWDLVLTM